MDADHWAICPSVASTPCKRPSFVSNHTTTSLLQKQPLAAPKPHQHTPGASLHAVLCMPCRAMLCMRAVLCMRTVPCYACCGAEQSRWQPSAAQRKGFTCATPLPSPTAPAPSQPRSWPVTLLPYPAHTPSPPSPPSQGRVRTVRQYKQYARPVPPARLPTLWMRSSGMPPPWSDTLMVRSLKPRHTRTCTGGSLAKGLWPGRTPARWNSTTALTGREGGREGTAGSRVGAEGQGGRGCAVSTPDRHKEGRAPSHGHAARYGKEGRTQVELGMRPWQRLAAFTFAARVYRARTALRS